MNCIHCYVPNIGKSMKFNDADRLVQTLAETGFKKINFAGGEPMLYHKLDDLIRQAKKCDMITSMVSNGSRITDTWLDKIHRDLDWIALSIDSDNPEVHRKMGRIAETGPISKERYLHMAQSIKLHGIRLKINTVVTQHNWNYDLSEFIKTIHPDRWKILQALPISGQNDNPLLDFEITKDQFNKFVKQNRTVEDNGINVVCENNEMMKNSYVMINPEGCFFDNACGIYEYSSPILDVGIEQAMQEINIDHDRFKKRGGYYDW